MLGFQRPLRGRGAAEFEFPVLTALTVWPWNDLLLREVVFYSDGHTEGAASGQSGADPAVWEICRRFAPDGADQ